MIGFSVLGLTGCISYYVPPTSGATATITGTSSYSVFQGAKQCTDPRRMPLDKPNKIPAGKLNTFIAEDVASEDGCTDIVFSFVPKANNQYQLSYGLADQSFKDVFLHGQKCTFQLNNLTTKQLTPYFIRETSVVAELVGGNRPLCVDQLAKK